MKVKSIKDNIHGYIELEEEFWKIIDMPEFQRLKWIEQTSYRVLYPSARHDRFIHSIGTFHLGKMAYEGFKKNACQILDCKIIIEQTRNSFLLACLLHDIGHAPLSHTCEDLFNYNDKISNLDSPINKQLFSIIDSNEFMKTDKEAFFDDYKYIINATDRICKPPSEHEVMSSIVIINNFKNYLNCFPEKKLNLDLVIRAIMGCVYSVKPCEKDEIKLQKGIYNCLIRLLNSTAVDVDKLDYITRDTMMSGYDNLIIDNKRLLKSLSIINHEDLYYPAFKKSALSVINNVVTAKNAQARWIINHPVVQYECFLVRQSIGVALKNFYEKHPKIKGEYPDLDSFIEQLFSFQSLSKEGIEFEETYFGFLSDIEIWHVLKQSINEGDIGELFERNKRRKPIWKSYDEFIYYLKSKDDATILADYFLPLINAIERIENIVKPKRINDSFLKQVREHPDEYNEADKLLQIMDSINKYCKNKELVFDFILIPIKKTFSTVINYKNTFIQFEGDIDKYLCYMDLVDNNSFIQPPKFKFFYLYSRDRVHANDFLMYMLKVAKDNTARRV